MRLGGGSRVPGLIAVDFERIQEGDYPVKVTGSVTGSGGRGSIFNCETRGAQGLK